MAAHRHEAGNVGSNPTRSNCTTLNIDNSDSTGQARNERKHWTIHTIILLNGGRE